MAEIIVGRKGTQRLPISEDTVSRRHCRLTDNGDGTYTLENISETACTYVDGRQVFKTTVRPETVVQLGPSFRAKVADLLPLPVQRPASVPAGLPQPPQKKEPPTFSVHPLEAIWDKYDRQLMAIQDTQRNINLLRSASPVFTIGSGSIATLAKTIGWGNEIFGITLVMTIIGLGLTVYSLMKSLNDHSNEERKEITKWLQDNYVCPNPECHHFVGMKDYNILKQDKKCPYCGCKYTH